MSFGRLCDDDLFEVAMDDPGPRVEVQLYSRQGDRGHIVLIPQQLIQPDAIVFDGQVYWKRDDGRYYGVFSVVAERK